ncbi:MAG: hypothetical protein LUD72_07840, partial [Bacteroidales bacterium]|nr:hypothetical protein [Bacteroidales bacterium]
MNEEVAMSQEAMNAGNEGIMNEGSVPQEGMNDTTVETMVATTEAMEVVEPTEIQGTKGKEVEPVRERVTFGDVIKGVKAAMDGIDRHPCAKIKCPPEYMEDLLLYGYMHYC